MGNGTDTMEQLDTAWQAAGNDFPADKRVDSPTAPCPLDAGPKKPDIPDECKFLTQQQDNAKMPKEAYDRLRSGKATTSGKQDAPGYKWPNGSTSPPASVQTVDVDGQKVKVYSPTNASDQQNLPTTDQVAESLRVLPPDQRSTVKDVVLSPNPDADGNVGGRGGGGTVEMYKTGGTPTQRNVDYRMTHETGHTYQETKWPGPEDVKARGAAAKADGNSPSAYAGNNTGDDFCEFLNVYNATKGTKCEDAARSMYPKRYALMDKYAGKS